MEEKSMDTIKFKKKKYNLIGFLNVSYDRFQATIDKTDVSVDSLLSDLEGLTKITVTKINPETQEEIVKTYTKYTEMLAVSIYSDMISVELLNAALLQEMEEE